MDSGLLILATDLCAQFSLIFFCAFSKPAVPYCLLNTVCFRPPCLIPLDVATLTEKSADTTSPTTDHSTIYTAATWTRSMTTDVTNLNHTMITTGKSVTSYTDYTETSVKSSSVTSADPKHFSNSSNQDISPTPYLNPFSDQPVAGNRSEHYDGIAFNTTEEMRNDSMLRTVQPEVNLPTRAEEFSSLASDNPDGTLVLNTGNVVTINNEGKFKSDEYIVNGRRIKGWGRGEGGNILYYWFLCQ